MKINKYLDAIDEPVAIGGVGGSGTRLIAQCLKDAGFHIGSDLNSANDNLWFTLLFKRIEIFDSSEHEFNQLVDIFVSAMTKKNKFTSRQIEIIKYLSSIDREQHSASWLQQRAKNLLSAEAKNIEKHYKWGWKEPNSHIVIERLKNRIKNMKYIHVIRNGLDMAYSRNQNQLKLWGPHFINEEFDITPRYSLKYWCIIHKRVLHIGQSMKNNFLLLNYDEFCLNPRGGITELFRFLGLDYKALVTKLISIVNKNDSIGRYRLYGTDMFDKEDVEFVKSLGFDVRCG